MTPLVWGQVHGLAVFVAHARVAQMNTEVLANLDKMIGEIAVSYTHLTLPTKRIV